MTVTPISLPADFGNDGPRDAAIFRDIFRYKNGKLFWRTRVANCVQIGNEAGGLTPFGYRQVQIGGRNFHTQRIVWLMMKGQWPLGEIDHINGSKSDNCVENLRDVSKVVNCQNQKRRYDNKSGTTGVRWHKDAERWAVSIGHKGKSVHIGYFHNLDDAVSARKYAETEYGFHENHGRA